MARILLIEDERALADAIREGLRDEQHAVDIAHDGEEGLWAATGGEHELVILDLMLPKLDGLEICRRLRARGHQRPILMLTARDQPDDVVLGLDAGANDYLRKPFAFEELLAPPRDEPLLLGDRWRRRRARHRAAQRVRTVAVVTARDRAPLQQEWLTTLAPLAPLAPAALLAAALLGLLLARRVASPLARVAEEARQIAETGEVRPLPLPGAGDEIDTVVDLLNRAFSRLQETLETMARFTADAAHELRTPLTVLRTQAEVALRRPRPIERYRETLATVLATTERMQSITEALLTLSRADARALGAEAERVDPEKAIREVWEQLRPAWEPRSMRLEVVESATHRAAIREDHLRIALRNVLENAVRHSPADVAVHASCRVAADGGPSRSGSAIEGPGSPPQTSRASSTASTA